MYLMEKHTGKKLEKSGAVFKTCQKVGKSGAVLRKASKN